MTDMPYCKYGHYEEHDRLPECINELLIREHENHETFVDDCSYCEAERNEQMREYGWMAGVASREMSGAERREMESDRELMRDEFHV